MKQIFAIALVLSMLFSIAYADTLVYEEDYPVGTVIGDPIASSPALAARGEYAIGVRTIELVFPDQVDLANVTEENPRPLHDRVLTAEVWYPGIVAEGAKQLSTYTDHMGRNDNNDLEAFDFVGRAMRDAEPFLEAGPYPVIIVSHGYPGSRYLLSHLGENLATKGYVVIALEHTDTTHTAFVPEIAWISAIMNRTLDQRNAISALADLNAEGWLAGMLKPECVGMLGYSFGGYGLLRTLGAKLSKEAIAADARIAAFEDLLTEAEDYKGDKRLSAAVLCAPWGAAYFDAESFVNIDTDTLWLQGTGDTVVPHAPVVDMFDKSVNSDRYFVTFAMLDHSIITNPVPKEVQDRSLADMRRWGDVIWDIWNVNGYTDHFITAFFDAKLKGEAEKMEYLDVLEPVGANCVYGVNYWKGFESVYTAPRGMVITHALPQ